MRARAGGWGLAAASVSLAVATAPVQAVGQVVTDGSLGPAAALTGPNFVIDPALGQRRGANLFHSFATFSIGSTQAATFLGAPGLVNIVARVTGNAPSQIDGLLQAPANLYLLNPRGILFGSGATLNVAGSLYASTADYLRFSGGERFQANLSSVSSLSFASPAAFGFLDEFVGPISATGSLLIGAADRTLALVGGRVTLDDAALSVDRGTVGVIGVRSAGEVIFDSGSFDTSSFAAMADVRLRRSQINAFDEESSSVYIRGGQFVMEDQSLVGALASQPGPARVIDIDVDRLQLANSAAILTTSTGAGRGISIAIKADDIAVGQTAAVSAFAAGSEVGGNIDVQTGTLTIDGGPTVDTGFSLFGTAAAQGTGGAGNVTVHATTVDITGGGLSAFTGSAGAGGDITLVADRVALHAGAIVTAGTTASGNGGRVSVTARELVVDAGASAFSPAISVTTNSIGSDAGDAGQIEIHADALRLSNGQITSSTAGAGNGGSIAIFAPHVLLENAASIASDTGIVGAAGPAATYGNGGAIGLQTDDLQVLSGSRISATTLRNGAGGSIGIAASTAVIEQGGSIVADTLGTGTGGTISIAAHDLLVDGAGSAVTANTGSTQQSSAAGSGGNVLLSATEITLRNRATVSANTFGSGTAGRITIDGGDVDLASGAAISTASFGQAADAGDANSISIAARGVSLSDTGQVTTATHGAGAAGRLQIASDDLTIASGGLLQSSSLSVASNAGSAGDIFIDSTRVVIDAGSINARTAGGGGPASISISSGSMLMANGAFVSAVSTGSGDAGSIGISALDALELRGFSRITTEAQFASGGNIALIVGDRLLAHDSTISTSVLGGSANGGNILIDPRLVVLDDSAIVGRAIGGNGGAIDIVADFLLRSAGSAIDASSQLGIAGRIGILGFDVDLNSDIAHLPSDFLDAQQWLARPCASRLGTDVSSLTVAGRDGAYRSPLDLMPSPATFAIPDATASDATAADATAADATAPAAAGLPGPAFFGQLLASTRCR